MTLTTMTANKIRKLLVSKFDRNIFNVTSDKCRSNIGSIYIKFSVNSVKVIDVLNCLRDNGYDHFTMLSHTKEHVILSGYVSECNYSLAVFA